MLTKIKVLSWLVQILRKGDGTTFLAVMFGRTQAVAPTHGATASQRQSQRERESAGALF